MQKSIHKIAGGFLLFFGAVSLFMTLSIFFDLFGVREKEGNYILSVVWANFICAIIYIVSAYGFFKQKHWTGNWMGTALAILVIAYFVLILHIKQGGLYEQKTVIAMGFRTTITLIIYLIARKIVKK